MNGLPTNIIRVLFLDFLQASRRGISCALTSWRLNTKFKTKPVSCFNPAPRQKEKERSNLHPVVGLQDNRVMTHLSCASTPLIYPLIA